MVLKPHPHNEKRGKLIFFKLILIPIFKWEQMRKCLYLLMYYFWLH